MRPSITRDFHPPLHAPMALSKETFMSTVYQVLDEGKIGILESPYWNGECPHPPIPRDTSNSHPTYNRLLSRVHPHQFRFEGESNTSQGEVS